jgi:predicted ArsR family transcriptional regulator
MYYSVDAIKGNYHPNAYLEHVRNVKSGLKTRTKLLGILEIQPDSAGNLAAKAETSYEVVTHHLRLLEHEGTVSRKGKRPCIWMLTGMGQKRLT